MKATWADITKAKKILNWEPSVKLTQGLDESVKWFTDNQDWTADIKL